MTFCWPLLQYEMRANLNKFEGSSSISSDELFGSGPNRSSNSSSFARTDLTDIKEGVRQGVTKVAGRLSNFASGVMSSVQVRSDIYSYRFVWSGMLSVYFSCFG